MHHELEKFLSVVEYGSFTAAAEHTHVSQPALTAAVQSLENRYDTQLILRGTRPLKLTEAGRTVYETASRIRLELNTLNTRLGDIRSGQPVKLAIGAIDSVGMRLFKASGDMPHLEVHVDNSDRLIEAVRSDRLDMAFITEPLVPPPGNLAVERIGSEAFVLVVHPNLAQATAKELQNHKRLSQFVTYNPESNTYQRIMAAAKSSDIDVRVSFVSTSPDLIREAVRQGQGAALLPRRFIADDLKDNVLTVLPGFTFKRPIAVVRQIDKSLGPIHKQLIATISEETT